MTNCENCFGKKWYAKLDSRGVQMVDRDGLRLWRCFRCGTVQTERAVPIPPTHLRTGASILYFDLEVSYSLTYNYGLKVPGKYIPPDNLVKPFFIIAWSASYMHQPTIYHDTVTPAEAMAWDDNRILPRLNELMLSADILAGHNVDKYDIRRANARFIVNDLDAITGKKTFDTLKIARSKFAFESNRLDYICQILGLDGKDHITSEEWRQVMEGDAKVLGRIEKYNMKDVRSGKRVLNKLQGYAGKKFGYGAVGID